MEKLPFDKLALRCLLCMRLERKRDHHATAAIITMSEERTNEGAERYAVDFFLLDGEKISLRPGFLVGSDAKIRRGF